MDDKIYKKLNKNKPQKSVLDRAYAEMDEIKREKRGSRSYKRVFGAVAGSVCCIVVIVAFALIALNTSGVRASNGKGSEKNYEHVPDAGALKGGSYDYSGVTSDPTIIKRIDIGIYDADTRSVTEENLPSDDKNFMNVSVYIVNGVRVTLGIVEEEFAFEPDGKIWADNLSVDVATCFDGENSVTECKFEYCGITYYMHISSAEREVVSSIIKNLYKK